MPITPKTLYAIAVAFWALTIVWMEMGLLPVLVLAAMTELSVRFLEGRKGRAEEVKVRERD